MTVIAALLTNTAVVVGSDTRSTRGGTEIVSDDARKVWPLGNDARMIVAHWGAATFRDGAVHWTSILNEFNASGYAAGDAATVTADFIEHYWTRFRELLGDETGERDRIVALARAREPRGFSPEETDWLDRAGSASNNGLVVGGFGAEESPPRAWEFNVNIVAPAAMPKLVPIGRLVQWGFGKEPVADETDYSAAPLQRAIEAVYWRVSNAIRRCAATGQSEVGGDAQIAVIEYGSAFTITRYAP